MELLLVALGYVKPPESATIVGSDFGVIAINTVDSRRLAIDPAELTVGTILGQGHFGVVRKAKWNGIVVAVKQLRDDPHVRSPQAELEFERELTRMRALQPHKHVVSFFGVAQAKGSGVSAIVVEFCGGGSLETALVKPTAAEAPAAQWSKKLKLHVAFGIACGIAHLHRALIVHRDIAARNVLLTTVDGVVVPKVADFGMSRALDDADAEQSTVAAVGPLKWMAPEQIEARRYSVKSDVYSFATTLFELFTQRKPWSQLSNKDAVQAIVDGEQLQWPVECAVPRVVVKLARKCWALLPSDRPTMAQVQADLESESM